jgi:HK97 family phage major capsid protein
MSKPARNPIGEPIRRDFKVDRAAVNADARTVELCFASEAPVDRWFGSEVLDCKPGSVRLDRLNGGAALLVNHDPDEQVGVVESARVDAGGKCRAVVRFSKSEDGEEIFQDVVDGIRGLVSVGYLIHKLETEKLPGGQEIQRATDWEPLEISIVSIPADASVGVGRSVDLPVSTSPEAAPKLPKSMPEVIVPDSTHNQAVAAERQRIADCTAIANAHASRGADKLLAKAIADGTSAADFSVTVLRDCYGARKATPIDAEIGMSDAEADGFSIRRAVLQLATRGKLDGLERDADAAARKVAKREIADNAIVIPQDVFRRGVLNRAQNVGTATAGGFLVQNQYGPMIDLLRNKTVVAEAGATQLGGLVGDVFLPKHTGGATAYWVAETGALTDSQSTFGQVKLSPHRLGATVPYSTQFLAQTGMDAEAFIRNDLFTVLGIEKDRASLHGAGGAEPIGVQNTSGINATVTFGGAADWADVVEFETGIVTDNADIGAMSFVLSAATVGKWKTKLKDSVAGAGYLIADNMTANGYRVLRTNQVSGSIAFFGVWNQLVQASWAGIEVIVDPYALKKSGQVEVTVNELCDVAVRQPLAFNVSTDSAAQ